MTETGSPGEPFPTTTGPAAGSSPLSPADSPEPPATDPSPSQPSPGQPSPGPSGRSSRRSKRGADDGENPLRPSRTSGLWLAVVAAGLILILLIIFIVQNTQKVQVDFLGWSGSPPLAVALLVAAAAGILVTGLIGSLRIFQLRRRVKRVAKGKST